LQGKRLDVIKENFNVNIIKFLLKDFYIKLFQFFYCRNIKKEFYFAMLFQLFMPFGEILCEGGNSDSGFYEFGLLFYELI
jgi:hypothetical protein